MITYLYQLLKALGLTILIEGIVIFAVTRDSQKVKHNLYCNLMTNPLLNLVAILVTIILGVKAYYIWIVIGEILVLLSEWQLYLLFGEKSSKKAFFYSFITNAVSLGTGILMTKLDFY